MRPSVLFCFVQYFLVTLSWVFSLVLFLPVTIILASVTVILCKIVGKIKRMLPEEVTSRRDRAERKVQSCAAEYGGFTLYTTKQIIDMLWWFGFKTFKDDDGEAENDEEGAQTIQTDLPGGAGAELYLGPSLFACFCLCPCFPIFLFVDQKFGTFYGKFMNGTINQFLALNDMMAIVIGALMVLSAVPAMIFGTLSAFQVYRLFGQGATMGDNYEETKAFVFALYGFMFNVFASWTFALPAFSFNLIGLLPIDFDMVWQWRFVLPSDLLDAASGFTALSFLGALVKLVAPARSAAAAAARARRGLRSTHAR